MTHAVQARVLTLPSATKCYRNSPWRTNQQRFPSFEEDPSHLLLMLFYGCCEVCFMGKLLSHAHLPRICFLTNVISIYISPRTFLLLTNSVCRAADC